MFDGIITPIVTPFYNDKKELINYGAMETLIDHLISKGVSGVFPLGSNGEFHVLSNEEKISYMERVINYVNKRIPVYVGTGACSTKETIFLSQKAEQLGADALSIITPYFIKPTDDEIISHYKKVAESVSLPIILYNIPKNTGINISEYVLKELISIPNIMGIKDSSGDIDNLKKYIDLSKEKDFFVLVGSDSKILDGYILGASGAIAGTSNLITDNLVKLDKAFRSNDIDLAKEYQLSVEKLRESLKLGTVPSILKRSMELAGIADVGPARFPVFRTTPETDKLLNKMLDYYDLI